MWTAAAWRWSRWPRGRSRSAAAPRASPTTTSARATATSTARFTIGRTPVTNATWLSFTEGGGYERASGGPTRAGRGRSSTTSPTTPAPRPGSRTRPSSTSPGSRPMPSPAPTRRACRRRSSGRRPRPGASSRGPARSGNGPRARSPATQVSSRARTGSIPKCSSATATGCCAAVRCATHPRVASPQFRNWDLPERRQLFAGVRIAR